MRHRKSGRKLGRNAAHRRALFRNMTGSLLVHGRIETTLAKAKELRGHVEPIITKARGLRGEIGGGERALHLRRLIASRLPTAVTAHSPDGDRLLTRRNLLTMLIDEIAPRYVGRPGGYTRIRRVGFRKGDNAPLVVMELVPAEAPAEKPSTKQPAGRRKAAFFRRGKAEATAQDEAREKKR